MAVGDQAGDRQAICSLLEMTLFTLHLIPYTLCPILCRLFPAPCTLCPILCRLVPTPSPHTFHPTPHTPHPTRYTLDPATPRIPHTTPWTPLHPATHTLHPGPRYTPHSCLPPQVDLPRKDGAAPPEVFEGAAGVGEPQDGAGSSAAGEGEGDPSGVIDRARQVGGWL